MFDLNVDRIERLDLAKNTLKEARQLITSFEPNAFYMAKVVNTEDIYSIGRIKIRIPAIHGTDASQKYYLTDSALPWARPAIFAAGGNDMGQFIIPPVGSTVFVTFEYNDAEKPIYFGGVPTLKGNDKYYNDNRKIYYGKQVLINSNDRIKDLESYSAQTVLFKSLKGSTIIINDKDGSESIKIIDAAGQQIIMENSNGQIPLERRGTNTLPKTTASIRIISGGQIKLDCDDFNIDANTTNIPEYVPVSTGDLSYEHSQSTASTSWTIAHNLNKYASVTLVDSNNKVINGDITYTDKNNIVVTFNEAVSGKAFIN